MEATMIGFAVGIAVGISVVVAAAIFTGLDVFLALKNAKAALGRNPGYFNIMYRPKYGTEFCRAHLVGKAGKLEHKALYLIEIHPKDADKAYAWAVPEEKLFGGHLLEEGKFYIVAFKEELYD